MNARELSYKIACTIVEVSLKRMMGLSFSHLPIEQFADLTDALARELIGDCATQLMPLESDIEKWHKRQQDAESATEITHNINLISLFLYQAWRDRTALPVRQVAHFSYLGIDYWLASDDEEEEDD